MDGPVYIMAIGVPASGKSTFLNEYFNDMVIYSSDYQLEAHAKALGMSYSEVFKLWITQATEEAEYYRNMAFKYRQDVVDDHTNLTPKTRAKRLAAVPIDYTKIAFVFDIPEPVEHRRRLDSRPGKTIPVSVMVGMVNSFEPPTYDEGFDIICNFGNGDR